MEAVLTNTNGTLESFVQLTALEPGASPTVSRITPAAFTFTAGEKYGTYLDATGTMIYGAGSTTGTAGQVQLMSTTLTAGDIGLRTQETAVSFYYLFVVSRDD
jgi:hypothetical protein